MTNALLHAHHDAEAWVRIVNERPITAPQVFGSAVVLRHVERLIETGSSLSPETCGKCAQLVKYVKAAERGF